MEKPASTVVAKAEPGKPGPGKKPAGERSAGAETKAPVAGAQADASGAEPEFRWPARGRIIRGFKTGGNDGINISVPAGTSVRAAENGVVVYSGDGLKGYGNLVLIKHPNGFVTAYANNGELDVKRGETVKRGQVIAKSGNWATSTRRSSISSCARDRPRSIRPNISPASRGRAGSKRSSPDWTAPTLEDYGLPHLIFESRLGRRVQGKARRPDFCSSLALAPGGSR